MCPTICNPMNCQASLSITNFRSSNKLMSTESVMPSSHLILCRPLFLLSPIPPSIKTFSNGVSAVCTVVGCQWRALEDTTEGVGLLQAQEVVFFILVYCFVVPRRLEYVGTPRVPCPAVCPEPTAQPDDCFATVSLGMFRSGARSSTLACP